jgi:hypothetical protein
VRHIISIYLDQRLIKGDRIANAFEPSSDRQPEDAGNLWHFYFCSHNSLILAFACQLCVRWKAQPPPIPGRADTGLQVDGARLGGWSEVSSKGPLTIKLRWSSCHKPIQ